MVGPRILPGFYSRWCGINGSNAQVVRSSLNGSHGFSKRGDRYTDYHFRTNELASSNDIFM